MTVQKGNWVLIHNIILTPENRASQLPDDTKKVPLEKWVKGFLLEDSDLGMEVSIKTITGRIETGTLVELNPTHNPGFGKFVPEILPIGIQLKEILNGGEGL